MTRFGYVMATYFTVLGVGMAAVVPTPVRWVWNASASVPLGLYALRAPSNLQREDLVAAMPPKPLADFLVGRGYLGQGVPLLKHVAALPGQTVCRYGHAIAIDGKPRALALDADRLGRPLPVWQGCQRIAEGSVFLLNPAVRDSLDGRYFGAVPASAVIGKAAPIYTDATGGGRFVWHEHARAEAD